MRHVREVLGPVAGLPFLLQKALSFSATMPSGALRRSDLSPTLTSASAPIGSLMLTSTGTTLVLSWPASRRVRPVAPFFRQRVADPGGVRDEGLPLSGRLAPQAVHAQSDA